MEVKTASGTTIPLLAEEYTEVRPLGRGSYGSTSLMRTRDGSLVVRKRIDLSVLTDLEKRLCLNEIQIASKMYHPHIVTYLGSYVDRNYLCIITEYCRGGDLHQYIAHRRRINKPIKEQRILIWLTQILSALDFLHSNHTLHRDLKSLNILIDSDKNIKLCDFGVSKSLTNTGDNTNTIIGTPYYFSPELINGNKYSWPSDIWALGCLIHELATFRTPFDGANGIQHLCKLINYHPVPDLPDTYSRELNMLYKSMMFHDLRFRLTAAELLSTDLIQRMIKSSENNPIADVQEGVYSTLLGADAHDLECYSNAGCENETNVAN
ncbi:protein kinase domain containing protein [Theileria equi strain WA]|uniref:non-specific serine/threonine protein kinase n=1 Tax=Theileria equi strain WA TaxID=1537102 RepID=L1LF70_THEEQ|nr:protein kinase domain containing protein [Theileria equi strain WA]EKX74087.1 protein kinase domain containing protein [Theileria equi strain WA]|eukprot:XP_004833539.1 protein kinase domain containing protein [Theileria equi strain WA]